MSTDPHDIADVPAGPPWTLDVLADLHAGRYPAEIAGPLRQRIAGDPWATSVLTALDATVDRLSLLPTPRMPERFALRLDAAIAAEQRAAADAAVDGALPHPRQAADQNVSSARVAGRPDQTAPSPPWRPSGFAGSPVPPRPQPDQPFPRPTDPGHPSQGVPPALSTPSAPNPPVPSPPVASRPAVGRSVPGGAGAFAAPSGPVPVGPYGVPVRSLDAARAKRRRWVGGLAAAAAVVAIGTATIASLQHSDGPGNQAVGPAPAPAISSGSPNALELDPGRFGDALKQIEGKRPAGPLQDAGIYSRCLAANKIDPSAVSGVLAATFEGRPAAAIAVVVDAGHSRVVVVGPNCGIDGAADQLAAQTVSR